jgi:glycosyltransferase involved in cell wall biosynthesis
MRILYITSELPYPLTSGFLRHYHFLRGLGRRHSVTLVTLTKRPELSQETAAALGFLDRLVVLGLPHESGRRARLPGAGRRLERALRTRRAVDEMKQTVQELVRREPPDVLVFSGKPTFRAIEDLDGVPIVMDCGDATSLRLRGEMRFAGVRRRGVLLVRSLLARRLERRQVHKTPHLAFTSERDRTAMTGTPGRGEVLPQPVDLEYWQPASAERRPARLLFHGALPYPPNDDAAVHLVKEIAPRVRERVPELEVFLVGRDPSARLLAAARNRPWVNVTGEVRDVRPHFDAATVYCAPLRFASGIQNKLLEALAMGVPVVTTPVAADGLAVDGAEPPLVVVEAPDEMAARIVGLLGDEEERGRLAAAGRRFVEEHYAWEQATTKLERMCEEAVAEWRRERGAAALTLPGSVAEDPARQR